MAKILPFKPGGTRPLLRAASRSRQLVRVWREELEVGSYCGRVGAMGSEFFALWVLGDNLAFDGIQILRQRDISAIEAPDHYHAFLDKAMQLHGLKPGFPDGLQLDDTRAMVQSVAALRAVMSLRVDNGNPEEADVCYVGRPADCEEDGFWLQEISPDATWLDEASFFAWAEIASACFDDPYATTLARVAGKARPLTGDLGRGRPPR